MKTQQVYLGLGGNLGDPVATFKNVLEQFSREQQMTDLRCSPFYLTSPVSAIPQGDYINAVCTFSTTLTVEELRDFLVSIEKKLGKHPKEKDAPRIIDIDILFYGTKRIDIQGLEIPHPRWQERLFVLRPLADLTDTVAYENEYGDIQTVNLNESLKNFTNRHDEVVKQLEKVET